MILLPVTDVLLAGNCGNERVVRYRCDCYYSRLDPRGKRLLVRPVLKTPSWDHRSWSLWKELNSKERKVEVTEDILQG